MKELKRRAGFFVIKYESIHDEHVSMLDLYIWKGRRFNFSGLLDHRVNKKDTSIWTPLSYTSDHPPQVHRTWPASMLRRHAKTCTTKSHADKTDTDFLLSIRDKCFEPCTYVPNTLTRTPTSRIVFPFNQVWRSAGLGSLIRRITETHSGIERTCFRSV